MEFLGKISIGKFGQKPKYNNARTVATILP